MVKDEFALNGTPRQKRFSRKVYAPALALSATLLASLLAGCQTTGLTGIGATNAKVVCTPWRPIYYSRNDTQDTQVQVRVHNRTGERMSCPNWKEYGPGTR